MDKKGWLNQVLEKATKEVQTWPDWMRVSVSMEASNEQVSASDSVAAVLNLKDQSGRPTTKKSADD